MSSWTLTIVSVSVVFTALVILWGIYSLSGRILGEKEPKEEKTAVQDTQDGELVAAISLALHQYCSDSIHDIESGVITIEHRESAWDNKNRNFRKSPKK